MTGALVASMLVCAGAADADAVASTAPLGTYTIGSRPIALNQAVDPGMGSLTPTADASRTGMFGPQVDWPLLPLHATVARNGHLVTYGSPLGQAVQHGSAFDNWDPSAGFGPAAHVDTPSMDAYDSFCNSAVALLDGRLLMVSGQLNSPTSSESMTMLYDPVTKKQEMGADIAYRRWYVTSLRLVDGRILLLGGGNAGNTSAYQNPGDEDGVATMPEIGTGTGPWSDLRGAQSADLFGAADNHWWYPRAFNGPNGDVVGFSGDQIWSLSTANGGSIRKTGVLPFNPKVAGSQVMYAPGKVLVAGGGSVENGDAAVATNDAAIIDFNGASPVVTSTHPMADPRNWLNLTVLPTGEVLANGGTRVGTAAGDANSVKQAEIWNPTTGTWRAGATAQRTRTYHSTSVLLPSGAVFTGGGGGANYTGSADFGPENNLNAEMYYPSYLFTKDRNGTTRWASRPAVTAISGSATYGGRLKLSVASSSSIKSASLITLPAVTHSQDTDQRRIPLTITRSGSTVTATLPSSANRMPTGDYELTVVDSQGVPSTAQIISIRPHGAGAVTVGAGRYVKDASAGKATTYDRPKLVKGSAIGLVSAARPGYRVRHTGRAVGISHVTASSTKATRRAATWIVRPGLSTGSGVSFESADKPGYYLSAPSGHSGQVTLAQRRRTTAFAQRATFAVVPGAIGHGDSIRLLARPSLYLRTKGGRLVIGTTASTRSSRTAATFTLVRGLTSTAR